MISCDIFRPDAENFKMCLPYYLMSGLSISDIVHQAIIYKQQSKKVYLHLASITNEVLKADMQLIGLFLRVCVCMWQRFPFDM